MVKILKLFMIILFLTIIVQSCKPTQTIIEKNHIVSDTLIKTKTEIIQLPTHYTLIDKAPCKNDSLIISDQYLEIGKLRVQIKNLNGQLVIEANTDSIINSKVNEILKHSEKQIEYTEKIVTKNVIPKWIWYILGIIFLYIVYRITRIFIPFLKIFPI